MNVITTSWDDGHPLDFKLADLLAKYNLSATFYIPQTNAERPVMEEKEIQRLAKVFEVGGHTLNHVRLTGLQNGPFTEEIRGCHQWLSQLLGNAPASFCFPGGACDEATLQTVFQSGFTLARTTELFSTAFPAKRSAAATTMQAYPHTGLTYAKHLAKRHRWKTLLHWMKDGRETDLCKLTETHLERLTDTGGCFHLWGHSWEIEHHNLWKPLETIFKILANRPGFLYKENRELAALSFAKPSLTT